MSELQWDPASTYREVFEHSPDCIFVSAVDEDGGLRLIDGNGAWECLTGLSIECSRGRRLEEVVPAAYRERLIERHLECLRRAARFEYHGDMPTPDGPRSFHVTLTPIADAAGRMSRVVGVARDVSTAVTRRLSLLEAALDQVREAVYLIDEQGRPHYVNDEACRMLGYERETLLALAVWDLDPQWPAERWVRQWPELKGQGRRTIETRHRAKDGRLIPVEVTASYVDYQGRGFNLTLVRDISERKRAEQEFRALVENSPDSVVRYDRDCRRTYVNPALERRVGLPKEALLGLRPGELSSPDTALHYEACVRAVLASGQDAVFHLSRQGARGTTLMSQIRLVAEQDANGTVSSVLAIGRDISSLMETQRQLHALIEGHPDDLCRFDRDGRIVYLSPDAARRHGRPAEEFVGKTLAELEPQYGAAFLDSIRQVVETGLPQVAVLPYPVQGELRYWEVRHTPEIDGHGRVTGVLGVERDVTERRQADQTIRELHQRREEAREEERRHIAHELHDEMGQYLSALRMEVSLLRMRWGDVDPALRDKVETLQVMVDHVIQVIRNLVSSLRPPVLDIGIASALEWLVEGFPGPSTVVCRLHLDDASITLDEQQTVMVFRIVQESLTNVGRHAQASRVDVTLERRGADYVLTVCDNGCGFDPAIRPQRSLGLVGLQERAKMLGGRLHIRSSPGDGATISVTFPAATVERRHP